MNHKTKLRVLHLASSARWTGVAEPVTSLALYQQKSGEADVWLACIPGQSFQRNARERGVNVIDKFHFTRTYYPFHILKDIITLRRFVRENRIDVVHCHLPHDHWLSVIAFRLFAAEPILLVRSVHRFASPYTDPLHRWLFNRATDVIITPTKALANLLKERLKLKEDKVYVVYGAVDINRFHPGVDGSGIRKRAKVSPDAPIAGLVARLRKDRGLHWLIRALPLVIKEHPNSYFIIVGRGELKYWLKKFTKKSPLGKHVLRAGYQTKNLPAFYSAFDCSLFLGLGSDGSSRAVLEAMASGKPVIALNDGGLDEVITPGENGFLVTPQDAEELASAINTLFADRELCRRMGRNARRVIEERFTEERRARETLQIYYTFLERKR